MASDTHPVSGAESVTGIGLQRIDHIGVAVADLDEAIAFYGRVFGFEPRRSFEAGMAELIKWVATARAPVNRSQQSLAELQRSGLVV